MTPAWAWWAFGGVFSALLALDLVSHRGGRAQSRRAAAWWAVIWVVAGLVFVIVPWRAMGSDAAQSYMAAYFLEKSLSLDNMFVFLIIFESLNIPPEKQRTPLTWGIFGALLFRGLFIFLGAAAVARWQEVNYVFAALLFLTAWRSFVEDPTDDTENRAVMWLSRHLPVTHELHGNEFIARERGRRVVTPLLLAIFALELTDILFAVDSVPAAFAVTDSPYVIYASNAFAILGLRSLYIVMASLLRRLTYLHYGLSAILGLAGIKLVLAQWVHVPALVTVGSISFIIGISIWASLRHDRRPEREATTG